MKYMNISVAKEPAGWLTKEFVSPGDTLYFNFHAFGRSSFACEVKVTGVELVLRDNESGKTTWAYIWEDGIPRRWHDTEEGEPIKVLPSHEIVNFFFNIDEPVGHSVQLGGYEHVYRTLEEALYWAHPWKSIRRKKVFKALRAYRGIFNRWIGNQEKRVWVRRK